MKKLHHLKTTPEQIEQKLVARATDTNKEINFAVIEKANWNIAYNFQRMMLM